MDSSLKLKTYGDKLFGDYTHYGQLIGKLTYLTMTWLDISFTVSILSQFMNTLRHYNQEAAYRILRYLKSYLGNRFTYKKSGYYQLSTFIDADWLGSYEDRYSTTGYSIFLDGNLVIQKSKKQNTITRSSLVAEYQAMAQIVGELMWLKPLLLKFDLSHPDPIEMFYDIHLAISIVVNPSFH